MMALPHCCSSRQKGHIERTSGFLSAAIAKGDTRSSGASALSLAASLACKKVDMHESFEMGSGRIRAALSIPQ